MNESIPLFNGDELHVGQADANQHENEHASLDVSQIHVMHISRDSDVGKFCYWSMLVFLSTDPEA